MASSVPANPQIANFAVFYFSLGISLYVVLLFNLIQIIALLRSPWPEVKREGSRLIVQQPGNEVITDVE